MYGFLLVLNPPSHLKEEERIAMAMYLLLLCLGRGLVSGVTPQPCPDVSAAERIDRGHSGLREAQEQLYATA